MKTIYQLKAVAAALAFSTIISSCSKNDDGTNTPTAPTGTWNEVGSGSSALNANNNINTVSTDASGNVYASGNFTNASGKQYVAKWNGNT